MLGKACVRSGGRVGGGAGCTAAIGSCSGRRIAVRGLGEGLVRQRRVVGGGFGVREVGVEAERRAWCPQVIAIGGTAEEREKDAAV